MNRLAEVKPATTPLFLGVFRSEVMDKYVFKQADALTLYWFFKLALSGRMKRAPQRNSVYFWVDYGFAATQLYTNVSAIRDSFDRLCGFYRGSAINPGLLYPLSKITMPTAKGKRNYFGLNQEPMGELIYLDVFSKEECATMERSMNTCKLLEADPELTVGKKIAGPNYEIMALIEDLLKIHQRGKDTPLLFNNRLPKSEKTVTKTMIHTAERIRAIYEGRFGREYRVSPEFVDRNDLLITKETWERLDEMKGSWEAVRSGIFEAARNYRQWWWPENEPEKKDWLPKDISSWLFDNYNQTSLFLACLVRGPYPVRETAADRVYNSIPAGVRKLAEDLYQPTWDAVIYWTKIRDIVYWFDDNRDVEGNVGYWLDGGLNIWFEKYLSWLRDLAGEGLYLSHIGTSCPTWNAWCTYGARKHNFKLSLLKNR